MKRVVSIVVVVLVVILVGIVYYRYFFVFGTGVKSGELNYMVRKGYIFKTNEGRLIQAGIRSNNMGAASGSVQSNEFTFSVTDPEIMKKLETSGGATLQLHYKEYVGALPWRGMSEYVVDSIVSMTPAPNSVMPPPGR